MMVVRAIVGKMDLVTIDPSLDTDILLNNTFDLGAMVPNQVFKLLESPRGKEMIENIRHLLIGGSSVQANLEEQLIGLNNHVVSTYGMTETASHIAIRGLSGDFRSDVYECLPGITVALDEHGCLQIQVPDLDPFQTKDMAEVLSPTRFRILGRADDVIISGGIKYFPESIEKKLEQVIAQRLVISSLPDDQLGEKIVLVIEGKEMDTTIIQKKIVQLLQPFECPKQIVTLERCPETANGKIRRKEIKKRINDQRLTIND
jgi:O-succinylbenzoic acid--CoA ligase